jgi:bifunctional DNA-binding transcriptional regulator/antitoxin component of YhaV-PrlF toxin-antitoxin module
MASCDVTINGKPAGGVKKEVAVSKRGSLIIPKELIEELGFKVGDLFMARKTKVGISLKLV